MSSRTAAHISSSFSAPKRQLSRVPYLPGLDGMRAIAVVAVMLYHANHTWLSGGFLGVEVFFVISGYLITLLLIGEHERNGRVNLKQFWLRRARRLLPAVFTMMGGVAVYMALFKREPQGRTRGDFLGGALLRQQLVPDLRRPGLHRRRGVRSVSPPVVAGGRGAVLPDLAAGDGRHPARSAAPPAAGRRCGCSASAPAIALLVGVLFANGDVATTCAPGAMNGYWTVFGRCISVNEALYLGTFTGPAACCSARRSRWCGGRWLCCAARSATRPAGSTCSRSLGLAVLGFLMWNITLSGDGHSTGIRFDPWLFRGGFFLTGVATLMVIAAVTHQRAMMGRLLGNPVFNWVGTRSYGLYLYHWPIYQIIRGQAGVPLTLQQWLLAMAITVPITEASYRYIEMPIRQGRLGEWLRGDRRPRTAAAFKRRQRLAGVGIASAALVGFAGVSIAMASNQCVGQIECDSEAGRAIDSTTTLAGRPCRPRSPSRQRPIRVGGRPRRPPRRPDGAADLRRPRRRRPCCRTSRTSRSASR